MVRRRRWVGSGSAQERGVVLYMVVVVALLMMAAGLILGMHLQKRTAIFRDQQRNFHAMTLLDTGTAVAMARLDENFEYQGSQDVELDGGRVSIQIVGVSTGVREVRLTSTFRGERRRAVARVEVSKEVPPRVVSWRLTPLWE